MASITDYWLGDWFLLWHVSLHDSTCTDLSCLSKLPACLSMHIYDSTIIKQLFLPPEMSDFPDSALCHLFSLYMVFIFLLVTSQLKNHCLFRNPPSYVSEKFLLLFHIEGNPNKQISENPIAFLTDTEV